MKNKPIAAWLVGIGLLLSGCGPRQIIESSLTPSLTPSPAVTRAPTLTPPATTPAPSATASPLPSATPTRVATRVRTATPIPPIPSPQPTATGVVVGKLVYVFCGHRNRKECDIFVMNADGSNQIQLTHDNTEFSSPRWSPDGTKIAFASTRDGNFEIYVMNADGSNLTRLTNNEHLDMQPSWSPEGDQIAFASVRDDHLNRREIYVMNADGSGLARLTNNGKNNVDPNWSPDGTKIVFASPGLRLPGDDEKIYVMNADGSNVVQLTPSPGDQDLSPAWSPDGTKIAFFSTRGGNFEIFVMNADGSNLIQLTHDETGNFAPVWSPDGKQMAFLSNRADNSSLGLYLMNVDGSHQTWLLDNVWAVDWLHQTQNPVVQHPDCTSGWTRLTAGSQAQISEESTTPNRVRAGPSRLEANIGLLPPGSMVKVLEGPICADGLVFWKVEGDLLADKVGWTAEGDGTEYYMVPYHP